MSYMKPYDIHLGNCLEVLKGIPDNSVDSIVTDPPYGLSFMGKKWDYDVPDQAIWEECLRVLKPGGHLLAFAGTRTQHRMVVRIEDAGFEIRDMIAWVYGSGFPKSMDVSKAIDKAAGAEREVIGIKLSNRPNVIGKLPGGSMGGGRITERVETAPATDAALQWQGWGTALKPALEPITVARKPFKGTVAANVLAHGTGALNIDGCRIGDEVRSYDLKGGENLNKLARPGANDDDEAKGCGAYGVGAKQISIGTKTVSGRWPANLIHDGSDEPTGLLGAAARFFYCAKASKKDRDEGLDGFEAKSGTTMGNGIGGQPDQQKANNRNIHPTVKPTDLMAYLCRLVTPPGGVVLDPFMGSGSTGKAAMREGFRFIGIEMDADYLAIAEARIAHEAGK